MLPVLVALGLTLSAGPGRGPASSPATPPRQARPGSARTKTPLVRPGPTDDATAVQTTRTRDATGLAQVAGQPAPSSEPSPEETRRIQATILLTRGQLALKRGRPRHALELFRQALRLGTPAAQAEAWRAAALLKLGRRRS